MASFKRISASLAVLAVVGCGSSAGAAVMGSDGAYLDWVGSDGLAPWNNSDDTVTIETIDGRESARLLDTSDDGLAIMTWENVSPSPTAEDDQYVIQFDVRFNSDADVNGNAILMRERPTDGGTAGYLWARGDNRYLRWRFDGEDLVDQATGEGYSVPLDKFVRYYVQRESDTNYHIYVYDGILRDLGEATVPEGLPDVLKYQFGTGISSSDKKDYAYSSFSVGEGVPVPEPATATLILAVGGGILATRRRRTKPE